MSVPVVITPSITAIQPGVRIEGRDATMGRFLVLPLAGLLALAAAAPVAAGANVRNDSGSFREAYGTWGSFDEGPELETYGEFFVVQTADGGYLEYLSESTGTYVECAGGEIGKDDTGGEYYGFVGTRTFAWGETSLSLTRRLTDGSATGSIQFETSTIDECAGVWDVTASGDATLDLQLTGVGDLVSFKTSDSVKIPGSLNGHSTYKGIQREASGTIDFGLGSRTLDDAAMASVTWTDHCNGSACGY